MMEISRYLVLCLISLSISGTGQDLKIVIDHPDRVNAGSDFTVTVTIDKGSLTDYSRFSQDIPYGLSASNISSPNADFTFDDQRIRIIWLKLPEESKVTVTYRISVDERLSGSFILGGVFAYVVEDERKFLNFERSREITITPSSTLDPARIVDIKNFKSVIEGGSAADLGAPYAMVIRQKPVLLSSGSYLVRLLVKNPVGSKYAKIEETIPSGYLFEEVSSHKGIVSFAASTVKFIWMKLPEEPEFEVVYRLTPKRDEAQGNMLLEGLFTYTIGNENQLVEVKEVDAVIDNLSAAEKRDLLQRGTIPSGTAISSRIPEKAVETKTVPEKVTVQPKLPVKTPGQTVGSSGRIKDTQVLPTGSGTYFRIQLIAKRSAFNANSHFRQEGVNREVFVEQHQGLFKYTVGSFQTYDQANTYRRSLSSKPSLKEAFVVAYRDGKRIPVTSVLR